ncbi:hypothetical protein LZ32DRAFT_604030 [Colletotrichum eremochloae]|nr:hypothetical protein LZ32DRAFT_604030 [Colletotrichum eremochloae]
MNNAHETPESLLQPSWKRLPSTSTGHLPIVPLIPRLSSAACGIPFMHVPFFHT